ncbi:MAG TPA: hypothetical protein V6D05_13975 [Stenomitos sp.]
MPNPDQPLSTRTAPTDHPARPGAGATAPAEPETELPPVVTWTIAEGDSSVRLTIVHSGFGGASQASLAAPFLSHACDLATRRAACIGHHSLYLALVG